MLPASPSAEIKTGFELYGDGFNEIQLQEWFEIESEGFSRLEMKSNSSKLDPWYGYNRYINEKHVWNIINRHFSTKKKLTVLVLGPGPGDELVRFAQAWKDLKLRLIEPSEIFREALSQKFPTAIIENGNHIKIVDTGDRYDAIIGLQVLHHIANVSSIIKQLSCLLNQDGLLILREPCSSMGMWHDRHKNFNLATPNERGISKFVINKALTESKLRPYKSCYPLAICLDPINKILKKFNLYRFVPLNLIYLLDIVLSKLVSINDQYWRDKWWKMIGPSAYHYVYINKKH